MASEIRRERGFFWIHLWSALLADEAVFILPSPIFSEAVELGHLTQRFESPEIIRTFGLHGRVSLKDLAAVGGSSNPK
jgi:hypothetical protein